MGGTVTTMPDIKDPESESISQQIRNQKGDEIPNLFLYSQLLLVNKLKKNQISRKTVLNCEY